MMPTIAETVMPLSATDPLDAQRPPCGHAVRALAAIEGNRLDEAEKAVAIAREATFLDRAWKRFLHGRLAFERVRLAVAEACLHQAASFAHLATASAGNENERAQSVRLAVSAWHQLGRVYRRLERLDDARSVHLAVWCFRERLGTTHERWETALELALDEDLAGRWTEAEQWYEAALAIAESAEPFLPALAAEAWGRLALTRMHAGRFDVAVAAADAACKFWRRHDPGCVEAALADARHAEALLKQGEFLLEQGDVSAASILDAAGRAFAAASTSLLAFGGEIETHAQSCLAQRDFTARLLESAQ
jgi:tetratricopeptide (TPR) repeat protein